MTAEHDDGIEILSCHTENNNFYFNISTEEEKRDLQPREEEPTKKQKRVARVVMVVALVMLLMSVLLVAVSLTMTDHIDDMVRNANNNMKNRSRGPSPSKAPTSFSTKNATNATSR